MKKAIASVVCVIVLVPSTAHAVVLEHECPPADQSCLAIREAVIESQNQGHGDIWVLIGAVLGAGFVPMLLRELLTWGRGS